MILNRKMLITTFLVLLQWVLFRFFSTHWYLDSQQMNFSALLFNYHYFGLPLIYPLAVPWALRLLIKRKSIVDLAINVTFPVHHLLRGAAFVLFIAASVNFFFMLSIPKLSIFSLSTFAVGILWIYSGIKDDQTISSTDFLLSGMFFSCIMQNELAETLIDRHMLIPLFLRTLIPLGVGLAAAMVCRIRCKKRAAPDLSET